MLGLCAGVALGANTLLATSLLSHAAASRLWTRTLYRARLAALARGNSIWIGGLVGLAVTLRADARVMTWGRNARDVADRIVARFSDIALVCVGTLALTGLYSAWLHVGSLGALWTTDYGRGAPA